MCVAAQIMVESQNNFFTDLAPSSGRGRLFRELGDPDEYKRLLKAKLLAQQAAITEQLQSLDLQADSNGGDTTTSSTEQPPVQVVSRNNLSIGTTAGGPVQ